MKLTTLVMAGAMAIGTTAAFAQGAAPQGSPGTQTTTPAGANKSSGTQGGMTNTTAPAAGTTGAAGAANSADTNKRDAASPGTGASGSGAMGASPARKDQEKSTTN